MSVDYERINNTMGKMALYLGNHEHPCVSVSGGSDSDIVVHIIATYFREHIPKIHFVFVNTGLEYDATKRHLDYLENHYDIHIDRIRGMSVVTAVHRYGVPVLSKKFSRWVNAAQKGNRWVFNWINKNRKTDKIALSNKQRLLAYYLIENNIPVSDSCCNYSKKKPLTQYEKSVGCDLILTGLRKAEGGPRSIVYKSCFEGRTDKNKYDKYMPLFFWNDETKAYYKQFEGIRYSDCYEVWGMKRTGCVGCPFNSKIGEDLKNIKKYEPLRYKACMNLFGESYRLMDKFGVHRKPIFDKQIYFNEMMEEEET